MDANLMLYGWNDYGECSIEENKLIFREESYIINTNTYYESNRKLKISASFLFKSVDKLSTWCYYTSKW